MLKTYVNLGLSNGFLLSLLESVVLGGVINITSFALALYVIVKLVRNNAMFHVFSIGLFFLYSLSPVLKILALNKIFEFNLAVKISLYLIHLIPLYVLIYLFVLSYVNPEVFVLLKSCNAGLGDLFRHFIRRLSSSMLLFWNFSFVYILFDTSKDLVDSSYFSFQEIYDMSPVYSSTQEYYIVDLLKFLPVLIFLLPSFMIAFFLLRKEKMSGDFGALSIFMPKFDIFKDKILNTENVYIEKFKDLFIGFTPIALYFLFVISFMGVSAFDWYFLMRVYISCITLSLLSAFLYSLLSYITRKSFWGRSIASYILFTSALLPGMVVGYFVIYLLNVCDYNIEWNVPWAPMVELELLIAFLLYYGIFAYYFISIGIVENEEILDLSENYKMKNVRGLHLIKRLSEKAKIVSKVNRKALVLSLMFFAVLVCNDSAITSSSNLSNMEVRNIAYKISDVIRNSKPLDGLLPIQLIIVNFILLFTAPYYEKIFDWLSVLPIKLPKIKSTNV